jgi:hypothetical protein|tara:strand:- start:261 stop:536 length:276 start_codon:yes stop_codon:yes gene_type:complete
MALSKKIEVDKIETIKEKDFYHLSVRTRCNVWENDELIASNFSRASYPPDCDISTISDPMVVNQFNTVMTDAVKANYQAFKEAQKAEMNPA